MATIDRFTASRGLQAPAAPNVNFDNTLARSVERIGQTITSVGEQIEQRQRQREEFKAQNDYQRFKLRLGEDLATAQENMAEDGAGFHDNFMRDIFTQRREEFLSGLPERVRPKFETLLDPEEGADTEAWSIRAAEAERNRMYDWATGNVQDMHNQLATAISLEPENYDALLQAGFEQIDTAPLTTAAKEELRTQWEQMAQVSHLNRMLETNPEAVINQLAGDPRYLSPTTQYRVLENAVIQQESSGDPTAVSPKGAIGLMQVMPGTARDIARELGDENFPMRGDPVQVGEYLSRPEINKRYGSYYLKKQLRDFNGDTEAALIAYNGGPQRAKAWLKAGRDDSVLPAETRKYYRAIMSNLPNGGTAPKGSPENARFIWVRDGGMQALVPGDKNLDAINPDLRDRVATAFTAAGVRDIKIRSGFRSPSQNRAAGGAERSQHLHGNAMDIDVSGIPIAKRVELIKSLSANGVTGIGIYSNTIHADMGSRRAWGPSYGNDSVPKWARAAIDEHLAGTARPPRINGRYASLPYEQRQQFISKADQVITARYNEETKATAVEKVEVRRQMDNELASIAATGQSTGFDETQVATVLGEDDYMKWADRKALTQRIYTAKQGIPQMSAQEMEQRLQDYQARPGSPNFAAEQQVEEAVQSEIERITRLRTTKPDEAALEYPEVWEAYDAVQQGLAVNEPDPEAVRNFVQLMLEKQAEFNIAPETRAPIPRDWALQIGQSLTRVPEVSGGNMEDVRAALAVQYLALQQFFGDYTEEVIIHSLSEYKGISSMMGELITGYMKAIDAGGDPLRLDADRIADMDQVESNNGRNWFQRTYDWFTGGDDQIEDVPEAVTDDVPSPEVILRIQTQLDPEAGPEHELMLVERYGRRAVDAAKAAAGMN